jgi:hypothetical protein
LSQETPARGPDPAVHRPHVVAAALPTYSGRAEVSKAKALKNMDKFSMHGVVLQIRVFGFSAFDVSRETLKQN